MINREFKIGDVVYSLHFNTLSKSKPVYLTRGMIVGTSCEIQENFGATCPEDLIHNLRNQQLLIQEIKQHKETREYFFDSDSVSFSHNKDLVFISVADAQEYLQDITNFLEVIS